MAPNSNNDHSGGQVAPRRRLAPTWCLASTLCIVGCLWLGSQTQLQAQGTATQEAPAPACAAQGDNPETAPTVSTLETIRRRGTLRYTSIPAQMSPFMALDLDHMKAFGKKRGKGVDYDLIVKLADRLGVRLELVLPNEPALGTLFACLEQRRADIAVGGLSILPDRQRRFDFSTPYYQTDVAVIGRKDSPWKKPAETTGLRQAMIPGASSAGYWTELTRPEGEILHTEFTIGVISLVADGEADIGVEDWILIKHHVDRLPDLEILFTVPVDDHYGIVFQKDSELVPLMDEILAEAEQSGELQRILDRHLP